MSVAAILVDATGFHPITVPVSQGRIQYQRAWLSGFHPPHSPLTVFEVTPFSLTEGERVATPLPPSLCSSLCLYPLILLLHAPPDGCAPLPHDVFTRLLHDAGVELAEFTQQNQLMLRSMRPSSHGMDEVARRVKRPSSSSGAMSVVPLPLAGGTPSVAAAPARGGRKVRRPKKCKDVSEESEANDVCELGEDDEEEEDVGDGEGDDEGDEGGEGDDEGGEGDDEGGDEVEDEVEDEGDDADDGGEEDGVESELNEEEEEEEELCDDSGMEEEVCQSKALKKARVSHV